MTQQKTQINYMGPFLTMVFLFFVIGFLTCANGQFQVPLKDAFLKEAGDWKNLFTTLITFSWFLAYPLFGGVGSRWVNRYGYKGCLLRGLGVMFLGLFFFFLSSWYTDSYPGSRLMLGGIALPVGFLIFLLGSFVVGASATVLQVVVNPYLGACHVKGTQPVQRLAMGGTSNALGTTVAPYFVSGILFGGAAMEDIRISQLMLPFIILMLVIGVLIFALNRTALPDIAGTRNDSQGKLERSVWSFSHLTLGVVAIFFYVGCEVCIGNNINLYAVDRGYSVTDASLMATLYWGLMMAGRIVGSMLSTVAPRVQLTFTTVLAALLLLVAVSLNNPWVLVGVGLFHSIMWGAIFTLAVARLGKYTSAASGVFMMGVFGGAVFPLLQGFLADFMGGWQFTWLLVLVGEAFMLYYAQIGSRIRQAADE